jgi:hypothetical protein
VAPDYQHVAQGVLDVFGAFRGPHSILLLSPAADEHVLKLGNYFRYDGLVKSPQKELGIITGADVARVCEKRRSPSSKKNVTRRR